MLRFDKFDGRPCESLRTCRAAAPVFLYAWRKSVGRRFVWSSGFGRERLSVADGFLSTPANLPEPASTRTISRPGPKSGSCQIAGWSEERWFQDLDLLRQLDLTCAEAREVRRPTGPGDERRPAATCASGITSAKIAPCKGVEETSPRARRGAREDRGQGSGGGFHRCGRARERHESRRGPLRKVALGRVSV